MDKEDVVHIYKGILAIKKNKIMPFAATWMDLEIVILSEVSQTEKDKYHMIPLLCRIFKKMIQMNLFTQQSQTSKTNLWLPKGKGGG